MCNKLKLLAAATLMSLGSFALPSIGSADEVTVKLSVPDMNCPSCPITVRKSIEQVDGVIKAEAFAETRTAVVTFDDAKTTVEALTEATGWYGYPSTVIEGDG